MFYAGEMFAFSCNSFTNVGALGARSVFEFSRYTVCSHAL